MWRTLLRFAHTEWAACPELTAAWLNGYAETRTFVLLLAIPFLVLEEVLTGSTRAAALDARHHRNTELDLTRYPTPFRFVLRLYYAESG